MSFDKEEMKEVERDQQTPVFYHVDKLGIPAYPIPIISMYYLPTELVGCAMYACILIPVIL